MTRRRHSSRSRSERARQSMKDLQVIVTKLRERGANIAATERPVDTSTAAGKTRFDMLGVFAEFETYLRRERQAEGIGAARRRGVYRGPPPTIDMEEVRARIADGKSPTKIAREMGISRGSVYKAKAGGPGKAVQGPLEIREDPVPQASRTPQFVRRVFFEMSIYAASVRLGLCGAFPCTEYSCRGASACRPRSVPRFCHG